MSRQKSARWVAAVASAGSLLPMPRYAQEAVIEEIIVTARQRVESQQVIPGALTVEVSLLFLIHSIRRMIEAMHTANDNFLK